MNLRDRYSREHPATSRSFSFYTLSSPFLDHLSSGPVDCETERTSDRREPLPMEEGMVHPEAQSVLNDTEFGRINTTGWYPHYKNCVQYFVECSQFTPIVQSVAAFINIRLPCQRPVESTSSTAQPASSFISLRPYVRRLIVTAQDSPAIMHAFFGDEWAAGVGCICKQERANYLFTAKSSGWADTKAAYDILPDELTPFLRPLREATEDEIRTAEARWSEWLAMEDWMVGARSPW